MSVVFKGRYEAVGYSETLVNFHQTKRHHMPDGRILQTFFRHTYDFGSPIYKFSSMYVSKISHIRMRYKAGLRLR